MKETRSKRCSTNCLPKGTNLWKHWYGCVQKISPIYVKSWRCGRLLKMWRRGAPNSSLMGPTVSCTAPTVLRPATLVVVVLMKPKVSFQAWHKAGRLTHGHDSVPVSVQQGFRRSSLQMTERGDSPHSTWIPQAALSKQAIIWYMQFMGIRFHMTCQLPLSYCHHEGQKNPKPRLGNSRTRTHCFMHNFQFFSRTEGGRIANASS